jgi:hypothetical protein
MKTEDGATTAMMILTGVVLRRVVAAVLVDVFVVAEYAVSALRR